MSNANLTSAAGLAPRVSADNRLDSWKEIAAYLKRDIRTVQRWEKLEGLPVRRHQHQKRGSAFAYRDELDAWWRNRGHEVDAAPAPVDLAPPPSADDEATPELRRRQTVAVPIRPGRFVATLPWIVACTILVIVAL